MKDTDFLCFFNCTNISSFKQIVTNPSLNNVCLYVIIIYFNSMGLFEQPGWQWKSRDFLLNSIKTCYPTNRVLKNQDIDTETFS